jgi:transcriptional regulator GlxA family with amidase domain
MSTLERTIRRHLGITPQQLLQRMRMNRARHLLTASNLKVGEIALACGYESFSAFSRAFRQTFGCVPGSLRGNEV